MKLIQQAIRYFQQGSSDKVYEVDLCEVGANQFVVNFRFGRRGATLKEGSKTTAPVTRAEADKIFNALVAEKTKKGYIPAGTPPPPPKPKVVLTKNAHPDARKQAVLAHLTAAKKGKPKWPLSRVIWRAGELKIAEAAPILIGLIGSGDALRDYCIAWALGWCGDQSAISALGRLLHDNSTTEAVRRIFKAAEYRRDAEVFGAIAYRFEKERAMYSRWYQSNWSQQTPQQGAPTSPAITNILCRRLDRRMQKIADEGGFVYTRYADDLTFSTSGESKKNICNVLRRSESVVAHEGLELPPEKTRVLRKSRQQEVTRIVVNEKLSLDRKELKRFRVVLFQVEKDGPDGKHWGKSPDVIVSLKGFANYLQMVDPAKAAGYQKRVPALRAKHGLQPSQFTHRKPVASVAVALPQVESQVEENKPKPEKKRWKLC